MRNTIDLRKDFDLVLEEKQRKTDFSFIVFSNSSFSGCLSRLTETKDGIEFYSVCPIIKENSELEQLKILDALECCDEKKYNSFCSWFEKNSFFQIRRSLVSRESAICIK